MKPKRISVADLRKEPADLLTGDKQSVPKLPHPPLVSEFSLMAQRVMVLSLYDIPFTFLC